MHFSHWCTEDEHCSLSRQCSDVLSFSTLRASTDPSLTGFHFLGHGTRALCRCTSAMQVSSKSVASCCLLLMPSCLSVPLQLTPCCPSEVSAPEHWLSIWYDCFVLPMCPVCLVVVRLVARHHAHVCPLPLSCRDIAVLLHAPQSNSSYALLFQISCSSRPILIMTVCVQRNGHRPMPLQMTCKPAKSCMK